MVLQITCYGAAQEVTGACHLVEAGDYRILLDCGGFQGPAASEARNAEPFPFDPRTIDAVILSHAHLDHSGRLPKLVRDGFKGRIYTQQATVDVASIILKDAAYINEKEAEWENRHRAHGKRVEPVYTLQDVERTLKRFNSMAYETPFEVLPGVRACLHDAGHILGSAIVSLWAPEAGRTQKIVFTGDLGHVGAPMLKDPHVVKDANLVLLESTYGDRNHRSWEATWAEFGAVIADANKHRGNILIPAFAVGRTQELLYMFKRHYDDWGLDNWRIFLDSPMALEATRAYQKYRNLYDAEALNGDESLFNLPNLQICRTPEESKALNMVRSGAIIIAGSGMCSGGRIRHHLRHNIDQTGAHLVIVGFQARGTLGRMLVDGVAEVKLMGERYPVRAKVHTINGLSAHADQSGLLAWYGHFKNRPPLALVHGEEKAIAALAEAASLRYGVTPIVPEYGKPFFW